MSIEIEFAFGENNLTVEAAKDLVGWRELASNSDEKGYLSIIAAGRRLHLKSDYYDQTLKPSIVKRYRKCIADRHWPGLESSGCKTINGEPIIIDEKGIVVSGIYLLLGFLLAAHDDKTIWEEGFPCIIVSGTDPKSAATIDLVHLRTPRPKTSLQESTPTPSKKEVEPAWKPTDLAYINNGSVRFVELVRRAKSPNQWVLQEVDTDAVFVAYESDLLTDKPQVA